MTATQPADDTLREQILQTFAAEARIDRSLLRLDVRADELGVTSLDVTLALFAIEDRFDIHLPDLTPGAIQPTVGELVERVLAAIHASDAAGAATDDATATPDDGTSAPAASGSPSPGARVTSGDGA